MDKMKRYGYLPLAFFILALAVACASAQEREFAAPATVESGTMVSPHAVSDIFNRVNIAHISQAVGQYARYANSPFPGESYSVQTVQIVAAWNPRISVEGDNRFVVFTYQNGGNYFPRLNRRSNGSFDTVFDGIDYAGYEGGSDIVFGEVETLGSHVYVVADTNIFGGMQVDWDIKFFVSSNNGAAGSFSAPAQINDTSGARFPALAASGSNVYAAWVAGGDVYFNFSTNNGQAWGAEQNISGPGAAAAARPGIAAAGDFVFIVWAQNNNVYFRYSSDGGANFPAPAQIADTGAVQLKPYIGAGPSPHLYVSWTDMQEGLPRIYFQEAVLDGAAFVWGIDMNADGNISGGEIGETLRVSHSASGNEESSSVAVSPGNIVYVAWRDTGSGIRSARYLPDPVVSPFTPEPPTNLTAAAGDSEVVLSWTASASAPNVDSYNVYRTTTRGDYTLLADGIEGTSYTDNAVVNGTIYWYVATAVFEGMESVFSNEVNATPQPEGADSDAPAAPSNLSASPGDATVTLLWDANVEADLDRYHVYSRTNTLSPYEFIGQVPEPGTQFFHHGLTNGVAYEYVVTAVDASNNESDDSNAAWATPGTGDFGLGSPPAPAPDGSGPVPVGPGGGCFIATAAYGSALAGEVRLLYGLRDVYLMNSGAGRSLASVYYRVSPVFAAAVSDNALLSFAARLHLAPFVRAAERLLR